MASSIKDSLCIGAWPKEESLLVSSPPTAIRKRFCRERRERFPPTLSLIHRERYSKREDFNDVPAAVCYWAAKRKQVAAILSMPHCTSINPSSKGHNHRERDLSFQYITQRESACVTDPPCLTLASLTLLSYCHQKERAHVTHTATDT